MVTWLLPLIAGVLFAFGELLHAARVRRLAPLAFGPRKRPAAWVAVVPLLRTAGAAAIAWGAATLMTIDPAVHVAGEQAKADDPRHLLLVLDVSPSMRLEDAGSGEDVSRQQRARELLRSLFGRVSIGLYKVTVIATYTGAKPVVLDTTDAEVVDNVLDDLPMHFAFRPGKTRLFAGLEEAARIAKPWEPNSTLLVMVTDGDTVPATGMPKMPASVSDVVVVGVGDTRKGRFIDGRQSRQDASTLRQVAARLGGVYHDGNRKHIPTAVLERAFGSEDEGWLERLTLREYALLAVALGTALLAFLPLLLHWFGTGWAPGARPRQAA